MLAALLLALSQPPATLANPGFESGDLSGWEVSLPRGYEAVADTDRPYAGRFSAFLAYLSRRGPNPGQEASLRTSIAAAGWRGRRLRVSARLRLEAAGAARLRVSAGSVTAATVATDDEWRQVAVELDVPQDADEIVIAISVSPGNDVQVDDVRVGPP